MEYVECIQENEKCLIGDRCWQDVKDSKQDKNGNECSFYYKDEKKEFALGYLPNKFFKIRYRFLLFGDSLGNWVNEDYSFLLKDIIDWCINNPNHQMSGSLLRYIDKKILNYKDLLYKEFYVKSKSFNEMARENKQEEYLKYSGYYLV